MDEPSPPPAAPTGEPTPDAAPTPEAATTQPERRDADGLPLDREPTMDDVRGDGHFGRSSAVGCSLAVVLVIAAFWVLRVLVLR